MKKILSFLLILAVVFSTTPMAFLCETYAAEETAEDALYYGEPGEGYEEGEVIVCVKGGRKTLEATGIFSTKLKVKETIMSIETTEGTIQEAVAIGEGDKQALAEAIQTKEEETKADEEKYSFVLVKSNKADVTSLIEKLEALDCVAFAEPNMLCEPTSAPLTIADAEDEPGFLNQWYSNKEGVGADFDVAAKEAYEDTEFANQEEVVVAVMDSGVDYTHPDLVDSMWKGGNITALTSLGGGQYGINTGGGSKSNPMDTTVGHGTHCASTIASNWKNEEGIAGINGNAKIMACRWMGTGGSIDDWLEAMDYVMAAKEAGVNVVATNNSWGGVGRTAIASSIVNVIAEQASELGIVNCFAAGNDEYDHDHFTNMAYSSPYIITVGAMQGNGSAADFSERGARTVDVFAPGAQILAATTLQNGGNVEMAPQYLPWLQSNVDTSIYEDFETDALGTEVKGYILDWWGDEGTAITVNDRTPGCGDTTSKSINLAGKNGKEVAIEVDLPSSALDSISTNCYIACQGGIRDLTFSDSAYGGGNAGVCIPEYYSGSSWETLNCTDGQPLNLNIADENCSVMSGELTSSSLNALKSAVTTVGKLKLRFAITVNNAGSNAKFYIDNIGIGKKASKYYYSDGTSMATPCAVAVASIIAGTFPGGTDSADDVLEIIARLKGGVKRTGKLEDECTTQGVVQATAAFKSDSELNPVPDKVLVNGDGTATIDGHFFGNTTGTVTVKGTNAEVVSWSNELITIKVPNTATFGALEYRITKANGKTGREFGVFKINHSDDVAAYRDLNTSDIEYWEGEVKTEDLIPVRIAANDDGVLAYLAHDVYSMGVLQFYSFETQEWEDVDFPDFNPPNEVYNYDSTDECWTSMVGSGHKMYVLMHDSTYQSNPHISTYDTQTKTWISKTLNSNLKFAALAVIDDELYATLGRGTRANTNDGKIYKINTSTGERTNSNITAINSGMYVGGSIPNYNYKYASVSGNFLTSGTTKIIAGAKMYLNEQDYTGQYEDLTLDPLVYDGGSWDLSSEYLEDYVEDDQNMLAAYGATDQGFIVCGPAKNIGEDEMVDTWAYKADSDTYEPIPAVADTGRFSAQAGVCYGNKFYLLARSYTAGNKLVFKSLSLPKVGLSWTKPSFTAVNPAHVHDLVKTDAHAATCTKTGNSEYWTCSICGKCFSNAEGTAETTEDDCFIPRASHNLTKTGAVAATCTAAGSKAHWHCSVCDNYFLDASGNASCNEGDWVTNKLFHELEEVSAQAATTTTPGNTAYWKCIHCNKFFSDKLGKTECSEGSWVIPATGGGSGTGTGGGNTGGGSGGGGGASSGTGGTGAETPAVMPDVSKIVIQNVIFAASKDDLNFEIVGLENLREGTDYNVHMIGLNPNSVGKHSGEIVFLNNYAQLGTISIEYVVVPQGTLVKKLSPKKKSIKVSIVKQKTQTTGYQIRYSLKSSMKSSKTTTIKKNSTTSYTIKKLKSKKKYYVQIRTYKTIKEGKKNVKYCSSWSKKKSIKVK